MSQELDALASRKNVGLFLIESDMRCPRHGRDSGKSQRPPAPVTSLQTAMRVTTRRHVVVNAGPVSNLMLEATEKYLNIVNPG